MIRSERARGALRAGVFALACAFILAGPALRQVFHVKNGYLPAWRMFRGGGPGVIDARFFTRDASGRTTRIWYRDLPGVRAQRRLDPPRRRRELRERTARLCRALHGEPVFVEARRRGWHELERRVLDDGRVDRCARPQRPGSRKRGSG